MRFIRPKGVLSGFWTDGPHPAFKELRQFGEFWAPHGWHVGMHTHKSWEVYYQAQGSSSWRCRGKQFKLDEGQGYVVAPNVRHDSIRFSTGSQHFYFAEWDLPKHCSDQSIIRSFNAFHVIPVAPALEPLFKMIIAEATRHSGKRQKPILVNLLSLMSLQLERAFDDSSNDNSNTAISNAPRGIVQAKELLENNLSHEWKLDELGHLSGMSPNYLSSEFSRAYGKSPMRYLMHCRLQRAKHLLLQSELSVTTIAHELGFSSIQHFSMRFKEHTGKTPSQYSREEC